MHKNKSTSELPNRTTRCSSETAKPPERDGEKKEKICDVMGKTTKMFLRMLDGKRCTKVDIQEKTEQKKKSSINIVGKAMLGQNGTTESFLFL